MRRTSLKFLNLSTRATLSKVVVREYEIEREPHVKRAITDIRCLPGEADGARPSV